jgi:hypothetical protein
MGDFLMLPKNGVMLVVADNDERQHYMLKQLLKRASLERDAFRVVTVEEMEISLLLKHHVKVLVPMGQEALLHCCGQWDIERWFGRIFPHHSFPQVTVMPLFAPSRLLPARGEEDDPDTYYKKKVMRHPPRYQGAEMMMLKKAVTLATSPLGLPNHDMLEDPSPETFNQWVARFSPSGSALSWDIETPYKMKATNEDAQEEDELELDEAILRISFAYRDALGNYHSVSVPWEGAYLTGITTMLGYGGPHVGWNIRAFDIPKVAAKGIKIGASVVYDGMDGFHLVQTDLDRGLEAVTAFYCPEVLPWKHLSQQPGMAARYSCIDAYAALRNWEGIESDLHALNLWDEFVHLTTEVMPSLEEAGHNGVHIDKEKQNELGEMLDLKEWELIQEAQVMVPKVHHKRKLYTRVPKEPKGIWLNEESVKDIKYCGHCGQENINVRHNCDAIKAGKGQLVLKRKVPTTVWWCDDPGECTTAEFKDWLSDNGFNPNSSKQMLDYMRFYGHPVGTNHKTKEDSADTKHLQKLVKSYGAHHPIYKLTVELHKVSKAKSTYVEGLRPDASGRVYTTYTNTPSTWRLSSRNVNMQNQGKRESNPYAKAARKTIIPPPGMVFVQADSSAIEAVMVGYFMGSESFIQLARDGVHDFLTCKWMGIEFDPSKLDHIKKTVVGYKEQRERMKRVVHGTNYGMGPYLMHMNEPETFPSLKMAKDAQKFYKNAVPELFQWQYELRMRAKKEGYLTNPWGIRHYFYDVFTYEMDEGQIVMGKDGNPKVNLGKDAKRVVAFKPQSSAGMFARDNCALLHKAIHRTWVMPANLTVHDGYVLAVPNHATDIEAATKLFINTLTRPIPQMEGLRVGCEVEYGPNWGEMTKIVTFKV